MKLFYCIIFLFFIKLVSAQELKWLIKPSYSLSAVSGLLIKDNNLFVSGNYKVITPPSYGGHPSYSDACFLHKYNQEGKILAVDTNTDFQKGTIIMGTSIKDKFIYSSGAYLKKYDLNGNLHWISKDGGGTGPAIVDNSMFTVFYNYLNKYDLEGASILQVQLSQHDETRAIAGSDSQQCVYLSVRDGSRDRHYIAKYDSNGNMIWKKQVPALDVKGMTTDSAGNLYLIGSFLYGANFDGHAVTAKNGFADNYLTKLNINGGFDWAIVPKEDSVTLSKIQIFNLGIYITGSLTKGPDTQSMFSVYTLDGSHVETHNFDLFPNVGESFTSIAVNKNDVYIAGDYGNEETESFVAKFCLGDCELLNSINPAPEKNNLSIYPNPTKGYFTIQTPNPALKIQNIIVSNALGQVVYNSEHQEMDSSTSIGKAIVINLSHKPKGIYFVEVLTEKDRIVKKVVLE